MTDKRPEMLRAVPVLQVADVVASAAFYSEKLGFDTCGMWGEPPCFCIIGRGSVTLFLDQQREEGAAPINQYWAAYVYVDDVDAMAQALRGSGVELVRGPEDASYGCREVDVRDLDGHIVCFGQDLEPPAEGPGL